jgi:SAM-dependent methyltransferase
MVIDRPTVLADACKMPFADKAFDFVIAFHVLEHVSDPAKFLKELQRVGKAGYIETPNAIFERLTPYAIHLLEIMNVRDTLVINKKTSARPDPFLNELDLLKHSARWNRFFYDNPELFHVRYFWKGNINFKIVNSNVSSDWFVDPELGNLSDETQVADERKTGLRNAGLNLLRRAHKLRKKNSITIEKLLACPECHGSLISSEELISCDRCELSYSLRPIPDFNRPVSFHPRSESVKRSPNADLRLHTAI